MEKEQNQLNKEIKVLRDIITQLEVVKASDSSSSFVSSSSEEDETK